MLLMMAASYCGAPDYNGAQGGSRVDSHMDGDRRRPAASDSTYLDRNEGPAMEPSNTVEYVSSRTRGGGLRGEMLEVVEEQESGEQEGGFQ